MKKLLFLMSFSLLLVSCSTLKVTSDLDKTIDFTQFKTYSYYGWEKNSDRLLNDLNKRRIEEAFAAEFEKRGMTLVKEGGDVTVSLYIVIDQKTSTTAYTDMYGTRYGYGRGWGWGYGSAQTTYHEYDYNEGTLVVDVLDNAGKKLVWQGVGSGVIEENPNKREYRIQEAAKKIMANYPIAPVK